MGICSTSDGWAGAGAAGFGGLFFFPIGQRNP
jgi:hypothetical protein